MADFYGLFMLMVPLSSLFFFFYTSVVGYITVLMVLYMVETLELFYFCW